MKSSTAFRGQEGSTRGTTRPKGMGGVSRALGKREMSAKDTGTHSRQMKEAHRSEADTIREQRKARYALDGRTNGRDQRQKVSSSHRKQLVRQKKGRERVFSRPDL